MSINGVAWERDLSLRQDYIIAERPNGFDNAEGQLRQGDRPESGDTATIKNGGQSWVERMSKAAKAAILATSYGLLASNM